MATALKNELQNSLARIEAVFMPGRLGDKRDAMQSLRESGDTRLFTGGLRWSLLLADYDKALEGEAESLDDAFGDMCAGLALWERQHGVDAEVTCAVQASSEEGGQS